VCLTEVEVRRRLDGRVLQGLADAQAARAGLHRALVFSFEAEAVTQRDAIVFALGVGGEPTEAR
jgi:hypothetical protein